MSFDHTAQALKRIIWQYRNSPKFEQWMSILPGLAQDPIENTALSIRNVLDLDNANTWQLDIIGAFVGQGRDTPDLEDDETYRVVIRSRIAKNNTVAEIDGVIDAIGYVTKDAVIELIDNQDMTFTIVFSDPIDPVVESLILTLDIIPRPQGVMFSGYVAPTDAPIFSFSDEPGGDAVLPFGDGFGELNDDSEVYTFSDETVYGVGITEVLTIQNLEVTEGGFFAELYGVN